MSAWLGLKTAVINSFLTALVENYGFLIVV
jgi:hypothetical protein